MVRKGAVPRIAFCLLFLWASFSLAAPASAIAENFALASIQNGKFVRAGVGPGTLLAAVSDRVAGWETFQKIPLGGNRVAIVSLQNGRYVRAGVGQETLLAAVSDAVRGWETFEWIDLGNSRVALRSVQNGKYVRAGVGPGTLLAAVSDRIQAWETFTYIVVPSSADVIQPVPIPVEPSPRPQPAPQPEPSPHPQPAPQPGTPGLTPEMQAVLDAHNLYRSRHCVPPLTWSQTVAGQAQASASTCSFAHSSTGLGENIWMGTSGQFTPRQIVDTWYGEAGSYNFSNPGYAPNTGHFTQIVWKNSTQLGCGRAFCQGMDLWVCNYAPAGNVMNQFQQNVLPANCQ